MGGFDRSGEVGDEVGVVLEGVVVQFGGEALDWSSRMIDLSNRLRRGSFIYILSVAHAIDGNTSHAEVQKHWDLVSPRERSVRETMDEHDGSLLLALGLSIEVVYT